MTTLHDRLADLAEDAPPGGPAPDLWGRGVRRHRRRRAGAVASAALVVALVAGVGVVAATVDRVDRSTPPADVPFGDLHLPRDVWAPNEWAAGTDDAGPPGPLAALSVARRRTVEKVVGARSGSAAFGVSAVDGSVRWLDLPQAEADDLGVGTLALSPDGTKVGYNAFKGGRLRGWAIYDTTTGATTQLRDAGQAVIHGADGFEIAFSGDSQYLQTSYSPSGSKKPRDAQLVVWDVETGRAIPAEGAGHPRPPYLGSAPAAVVWSRGGRTFTFAPETAARSTEEVSDEVVDWSYGPSGRAAAYIAAGKHGRAPRTLHTGAGREVELDIEPGALRGWRDDHTVVVENLTRQLIRYVDVGTGQVVAEETLETPSAGEDDHLRMAPLYAADLWANDLVDGVRPPAVDDPRVGLWELAGLLAIAALVGGAVWARWRRHVRA